MFTKHMNLLREIAHTQRLRAEAAEARPALHHRGRIPPSRHQPTERFTGRSWARCGTGIKWGTNWTGAAGNSSWLGGPYAVVHDLVVAQSMRGQGI